MRTWIAPWEPAGRRSDIRPAARRPLAGLAELLERWAGRRRQRLALLSLSDALLKDIGLGRGDAEREARKPFWRE